MPFKIYFCSPSCILLPIRCIKTRECWNKVHISITSNLGGYRFNFWCILQQVYVVFQPAEGCTSYSHWALQSIYRSCFLSQLVGHCCHQTMRWVNSLQLHISLTTTQRWYFHTKQHEYALWFLDEKRRIQNVASSLYTFFSPP